jgi:hypothetical protein
MEGGPALSGSMAPVDVTSEIDIERPRAEIASFASDPDGRLAADVDRGPAREQEGPRAAQVPAGGSAALNEIRIAPAGRRIPQWRRDLRDEVQGGGDRSFDHGGGGYRRARLDVAGQRASCHAVA